MSTYTKADLALVTNMNKQRLREACKAANITSYGKLDNAGMRRALVKHMEANMAQEPAPAPEPVVTTPPAAEAPALDPSSSADVHTAMGTQSANVKTEAPAPAPKGEQRNGVTKPTRGLTLDVWNAADALKAEGKEITFAALKEKLPNHNDATCRTQMQRWRVFTGLAGAAKEAAK